VRGVSCEYQPSNSSCLLGLSKPEKDVSEQSGCAWLDIQSCGRRERNDCFTQQAEMDTALSKQFQCLEVRPNRRRCLTKPNRFPTITRVHFLTRHSIKIG